MVDQSYIAVKSRKSKRLLKKQQEQQQKQQQEQQKQGLVVSGDGDLTKNKMETLGNQDNNQVPKSMGFSAFEQLGNSSCNLARFLNATNPSVPAQYISKTTMKGWRTYVEYQHYFTLGDLWDSFRECSAYGAGVPLVFDGIDDEVVQYYVPYLSAIQLYQESPRSDGRKARPALKDSSGDDSKFSSGEESNEYDVEEDIFCCVSPQRYSIKKMEVPLNVNVPSSRKKAHHPQDGFSFDEREVGKYQSQLLYQYFEQESPYSREPLATKVGQLATLYPQLKTLRSCDLHLASWISVAWYPIYRIPSASTPKDLDACFLTYHYLSMPLKGEANTKSPKLIHSNEIDGTPRFLLPAFGLASYKFKASTWARDEENEYPLLDSLKLAADNWLRVLHVNHPDFQFFLSRSSYQR